MKQKYTQTTYETCLSCSLLNQITKFDEKEELDLIIHSMKFSRDDFVLGHLNFIDKNYGISFLRIVDNDFFANYLEKIGAKNLEVKKINLNLIDKLLNENELIIYLDAYYLYVIVHYPHFITILKDLSDKYLVFDTWDGKEKIISKKIISKAISSLRNHLKFVPQILCKTI